MLPWDAAQQFIQADAALLRGLVQALAMKGEIMKAGEEKLVRIEDVAREFKLRERTAREIVMEQTRIALLCSGFAWLVLVSGFGVAAWLFFGSAEGREVAVEVLLGTGVAWVLIGRLLAGPGIRKEAQAKSARIHGEGS